MAGIQYKRREFVKIIRKNGFHYVRSSGGHDIYQRLPSETIALQVNPNAMQCQRLIKEFNLKL